MRTLVFILGVLLAATESSANTIVVMADPRSAADLGAAMRVVLEGRGVGIASLPAPMGDLRLERAAAAQRAAMDTGADAAVWIDDAEVCAVTSDGHDFRHAPFPMEAASPRVFAAIATSLLDEMIAPEPVDVDVNVTVDVTPRGARAPRVAFAGPPSDARIELAAPARVHAGRTLLEIGPMVSPLTIGVEAGLALPLSESWRFAPTFGANTTFDGKYFLAVGAVELRHVASGAKHWDIGPLVGAATDGKDPVAFTGVRLSRTWERATNAISLSLTPLLLVPLANSNAPSLFPGAWAALRWQFAL